MSLTLVVLAAGLSSRYGDLKQLDAVGLNGAALLDYGIYDAVRAGFSTIVLVIRPELERAFRDHIDQQFQGSVAVSFVFQQLEPLPCGFLLPSGRHKPWGTAHAILAAEHEVRAAFAVSNADDFYGASAYRLLSEQLQSIAVSRKPVFALVGYTLRDTLSPFGGVSRALCYCDDDGFLQEVVEVKDILQESGRIHGVSVWGEEYLLDGGETVSRNLWGFTRAILPILKRQFTQFLDQHGSELDAEFLISTAVNDQIATGQARLKVLPAHDRSFGMTFPQDKASVADNIAALVARGDYPEHLWTGVR